MERYDLYNIDPQLQIQLMDRTSLNEVMTLSITGASYRMLLAYDVRANNEWLFHLLADQSQVIGEVYRGIDNKPYTNFFAEPMHKLPLITDAGHVLTQEALPPREFE